MKTLHRQQKIKNNTHYKKLLKLTLNFAFLTHTSGIEIGYIFLCFRLHLIGAADSGDGRIKYIVMYI
jgi:hypothetical protein